MWRVARFILAAVTFLLSACTSVRRDVTTASAGATPTTQITIGPPASHTADLKAELTLDQIEPKLEAPATQPATSPASSPPPLEALELYARARDALASRHHATAISSLENAIKLDPDSAELHRTLARAYMAGNYPERAIDSLRRACRLDPADVRSQTSLGRLFLMRNDPATALTHLRLAVATRQYQTDEAGAAVADYFLARALQQQGYERAALEQYEKLITRLDKPSLAVRSDPELADWAERPAAIYGNVARLYEKRGEPEKALTAWRIIASEEPADVEARSRLIDMLVATNQRDEALREAADLVRRTGPSAQSLDVLRDVGRRTGREDAVYQELLRLYEEQRGDRTLLFGVIDLLVGDGREKEAEALLNSAVREHWDALLVTRLWKFYSDRQRSDAAAKLLIEASAARPNETPQLLRLFSDLLRPLRRDALRANDIVKIDVAPEAEAAKEYFVATCAGWQNRATLARESLDRAVKPSPPFAPAFRFAIRQTWARTDIPPEEKQRLAKELIDRAEREGPAPLAAELRAFQLRSLGDDARAAMEFEVAFKAGEVSPDSVLAYAQLQSKLGNRGKFEQACRRAISDFPSFDEVYIRLMSAHLDAGLNPNSVRAAMNVLQRWLSADPTDVEARSAEAQMFAVTGQLPEAVRASTDLLRQHPYDPEVLSSALTIFGRVQQTPQLVEILEELFARSPDNISVALQLAEHYHGLQRDSDAVRVAEKLRQRAQGDARLLFAAAQVYTAIDQKEQAEATMLESYRLNPNDAGVANDLGYTWADAGRNLDRAEAMIRSAVEAEPDNGSYLDSLGWVLYKRGRFDEARKQLESSAAADPTGDPVVLDHLADTLYRLHDQVGAQSNWEKSLERAKLLGDTRTDVRKLLGAVQGKLQQAQAGQPVNVAPTGPDALPPQPVQAKN